MAIVVLVKGVKFYIAQGGSTLYALSPCCCVEMEHPHYDESYVCEACGREYPPLDLEGYPSDREEEGVTAAELEIDASTSNAVIQWWVKRWTNLDVEVDVRW